MKRILLVDDDWIAAKLLREDLVMRYKYSVAMATTCQEALHLLSIHRYDIAVIDLMLPTGEITDTDNYMLGEIYPGMHGLDLASQIRKTHEGMLIIGASLDHNEAIMNHFHILNGFFLSKNDDQLAQTIHMLIQMNL